MKVVKKTATHIQISLSPAEWRTISEALGIAVAACEDRLGYNEPRTEIDKHLKTMKAWDRLRSSARSKPSKRGKQ
jgi:hypothetical protein